MHKKSGYILLLMFSILSVCMTLITTFFLRSVRYKHLMHTIIQRNKALAVSYNSIALGKSLLAVDEKKQKEKKDDPLSKTTVIKNPSYNQALLQKILPVYGASQTYTLTEKDDGFDCSIRYTICSESGKLNINALYDFKQKKFAHEGKSHDMKKVCQWIFETIAKKTKTKSLFKAFESYIAKRDYPIIELSELLAIPEFKTVFKDRMFLPHTEQSEDIYLYDIFTTFNTQETINPWFFSQSWLSLLNIKRKELKEKEFQELISSFSEKIDWSATWDKSLKKWLSMEYKNLPQELKSILTTQFEANIFSLLITTTIGTASISLFAILHKQAQKPVFHLDNSYPFDIVKIYQI